MSLVIVHSKPEHVSESRYGVPIGYYIDCDQALCRDCAPAGFETGDYSEWNGFESWEEPMAITQWDESDSPTHCAECERVIAHDLTLDGIDYVAIALEEFIANPGSHNAEVMAQWYLAYANALDTQEMIEQLLIRAGVPTYETSK